MVLCITVDRTVYIVRIRIKEKNVTDFQKILFSSKGIKTETLEYSLEVWYKSAENTERFQY